nr:AMP-binding protein [Texcoconibacillus texcoconensis]
MTFKRPWLAHYPKSIPGRINIEEKALHMYLQEAAEDEPEKVALEFMGTEMTYEEVYHQSLALCERLQSLGIEQGDRVAIMLPNCPQAVISYYGTLMAGAVVVQTNPLYVERELENQIVDSGAKLIICLDMVYPRVMNIFGHTNLEHVIVTKVEEYLPFPKSMIYPLMKKRNHQMLVNTYHTDHTHSLNTLIKNGHPTQVNSVSVDPKRDLALLQYTGGTTRSAKGCMLTHRNLVSNTAQALTWMYKIDHGNEVILCALPFFHVYGMTVGMNFSIMDRSKMVIVPRFEREQVLKTIQKQKVSIFPGTPTMYIGIINDPHVHKYDLSSVNVSISGSAPLPFDVQMRFEQLTGGKLVEGYGLTEASPVSHFNLVWGYRPKGSIGLPWPNTDVKVISQETGEMVGPGEIGEIAICGPQIMRGYWRRREETRASFQEEWLLTGDMGYMDEEGFFYIVDRKKDMIIAGGFNIYPREIEEVLFKHDDVQEVAVVGVPDLYRGETVKAFVVLKEGATVNERELDIYCRKYLAAYKVPKMYEFREELPKTTVGKVLKRELTNEKKPIVSREISND